MSIVIPVLLIVEYLSFLFYDIIMNRGRYDRHFAIRVMAGCTGIIITTMDAILSIPFEPCNFLVDLTAATEILMIYPCSYEKPVLSFRSALLLDSAIVLSIVITLAIPSGGHSFRCERMFWSYVVIMTVFIFYFVATAVRRFSGIRMFFRNSAVWHNVEDYSRFIYSIIFLSLGILSLCAILVPGDTGIVMVFFSILLFMVLYSVLYMRGLTGRTYVLNQETERKIKDIIKGNLRTSFIDKAEEDRKMNNLYGRVMLFMNEKKPYLDPTFCMEDMAEQLYSNKLYLSRTINILSGRNFRQFVNYHRIQYAMALFKKDPRLKVAEAASMSGFNSTVSFNMAFKVNTGRTPSEWIQEHAIDRLVR